MKQIFVHHQSKHHAQNSGYSRLLDYCTNYSTVEPQMVWPYAMAKHCAALVSDAYGIYDTRSVYKELALFKTLSAHKDTDKVVHFLNGERDIRFAVRFGQQFERTAFSATFHKPPAVLEQRISKTAYLERLQGAVCVGENQVTYIKERFKIPQVAYIPHGVDAQFFKPDPHKKHERPVLLFVGQHMRDLEALNYCVPKLAAQIKDLKVQVVIHKAYAKHIQAHPNLDVFSGIDDGALLHLYQSATALFLPLLDSTACNSILEALACGLPIITTRVGGNMGYLKSVEAILTEAGCYEALITETVNLLQSSTRLQRMALSSRAQGEALDWQYVAQDVYKFHKSLL
ncbi:glycosyltransferase family 4 protein [Formosa sp. A9]|uniref:glycosyltransferase family 4 protein n=1 Tax=Formosa sp. A9 TaxID=3442641 RepID=UPI003EBD8349